MARPSSIAGQIVNREELACFLARSPPYIDKMVLAGCPVLSRGGSGVPSEFNTAEVIKWLLAREADAVRAEFDPEKGRAEEGKRRFGLAAAELKELQLAEKRGKMISVEDVAPIVEDELVNVRSRLLAMPGRVAAGRDGHQASIEASLRAEVIAALSELAQGLVVVFGGGPAVGRQAGAKPPRSRALDRCAIQPSLATAPVVWCGTRANISGLIKARSQRTRPGGAGSGRAGIAVRREGRLAPGASITRREWRRPKAPGCMLTCTESSAIPRKPPVNTPMPDGC